MANSCGSCGFAGLVVKGNGICEMPSHLRAGETLRQDERGQLSYVPVCIVRAYDLRKEIGNADREDKQHLKFVHVVTQERNFPAHFGWVEGLTPKEHLDMKIHERMQQQDLEMEKWRQRESRTTHIYMFWQTVVFGLTLVAAIVGTIVLPLAMKPEPQNTTQQQQKMLPAPTPIP